MSLKPTRLSGLVMDMRQGETITLANNIKIHFLEKSGRVTRVRIAAPLDVKINKENDKGEPVLYGGTPI